MDDNRYREICELIESGLSVNSATKNNAERMRFNRMRDRIKKGVPDPASKKPQVIVALPPPADRPHQAKKLSLPRPKKITLADCTEKILSTAWEKCDYDIAWAKIVIEFMKLESSKKTGTFTPNDYQEEIIDLFEKRA